MNAIAVLTTTPSDELLEFYSGFVRLGYRVFVIIDDNNFKLDGEEFKAKNMSPIQIEDDECRSAGFFNLNARFRKRSGCAAWDKALYYFCFRDLSHDNVWLIEDDVFVPNHEIILAMDRKYENADIISADNVVNKHGVLDDQDGWPWRRLVPKTILPPPWAHSMVCAVRLSRKMLTALDTFILSNTDTLRLINTVIAAITVAGLLRPKSWRRKRFYIEYIFHTLALHNQLRVIQAQELSSVVYRKDWNVSKRTLEPSIIP